MQNPKKKWADIDWQELALKRLEGIEKRCRCGACNHQPKPKLPEGMRRLKVQPAYIDRAGDNHYVPMLMLKGEWLRKVGFDCRTHVIITQEPGRLVIRLEA